MRIAIISDIHGYIDRLDAVINDLQGFDTDKIISLGDVATLGPHPREVIQKLSELHCECVMGNHDEFLLRPELIKNYTDVPFVVDGVESCARQLRDSDLSYIATFKHSLRVGFAGKSLYCFHGTPESNTGELLTGLSTEQLDAFFHDEEADIIAAGHIHVQTARRHRRKIIINPGSVGMPFETYPFTDTPVILPWAEYALVEISTQTVSVSLRRVSIE